MLAMLYRNQKGGEWRKTLGNEPSFLSKCDCSMRAGTRLVSLYIITTALYPRSTTSFSLMLVSLITMHSKGLSHTEA